MRKRRGRPSREVDAQIQRMHAAAERERHTLGGFDARAIEPNAEAGDIVQRHSHRPRDSDIDLLVEFNRPIGLFAFARLQRELGDRLGRPVELVTPAALKPQLRERILREAVIAA